MNMQALLKQAKAMQKEMAKVEAELKGKEYNASVGGGVVKVCVNGRTQLTNLEIDPAVLNDKEELQEMIVMAVNDALAQMMKDKEETMGAMTSGIKMPGVF